MLIQHDDPVEVSDIMRALEPEVVEVTWTTIEPLLPPQLDFHPFVLSPAPGA